MRTSSTALALHIGYVPHDAVVDLPEEDWGDQDG